jgi:hypothetical protein
MNKSKLWTLITAVGLAVTSLLLTFLLLDHNTVEAASGNVTITASQLANTSFTVSGTVTCQTSGLIGGVEIFVWDRELGTGFVGDTTDSSGNYSVTLDAGSYDLIFNPPCGSGCASQSLKGITGPPSDQTRNVTLPPGHSVSGVVSDGTTPVGNVAIYAFNRNTADGFGLPPTKSNGQYCISLMDGPYELGFTPPACLDLGPKTEDITVTEDRTLNVNLPAGFTVAGCITDGLANPVPGVQIYAYDPTPTIRGFGFAPTKESGCYTGTLPLGTFDFQFIPPAGRGLGSITVVDVVNESGGCPNTSLPVTLPPGFTISGTVTCHSEPIKNVFVYADPVSPPVPSDDLDGWGLYTVDDGSYGLAVVPGSYNIEFVPPPATGFNKVVITEVQIITDTVLNFNFCPLYLPIIMKSHLVP